VTTVETGSHVPPNVCGASLFIYDCGTGARIYL